MPAAIEVLAIRRLDGKSAVKAFCDLRLGGVTIQRRQNRSTGRQAGLARDASGQDGARLAERGRALEGTESTATKVVLTAWESGR